MYAGGLFPFWKLCPDTAAPSAGQTHRVWRFANARMNRWTCRGHLAHAKSGIFWETRGARMSDFPDQHRTLMPIWPRVPPQCRTCTVTRRCGRSNPDTCGDRCCRMPFLVPVERDGVRLRITEHNVHRGVLLGARGMRRHPPAGICGREYAAGNRAKFRQPVKAAWHRKDTAKSHDQPAYRSRDYARSHRELQSFRECLIRLATPPQRV